MTESFIYLLLGDFLQLNPVYSRRKQNPNLFGKELLNQQELKKNGRKLTEHQCEAYKQMVIKSVMSLWRAMSRTESQGTCSIDHSLIMLPKQSLVLIAKWGTIETIVDIGEKVAVLKRRGNKLHMA